MNAILVATIIVVIVGYTVFFGAPYVPAKQKDIRQAFDDLYTISQDDTILDLGSGDGRVLREASRRGARAVGYELHPALVALSRWLSRHDKNVRVEFGNFWKKPFPDATTVVYVFGDGRDIAKMTRHIEHQSIRLGHPIYVLSYGFELPGHTVQRSLGAHHLYRITPLQANKP